MRRPQSVDHPSQLEPGEQLGDARDSASTITSGFAAGGVTSERSSSGLRGSESGGGVEELTSRSSSIVSAKLRPSVKRTVVGLDRSEPSAEMNAVNGMPMAPKLGVERAVGVLDQVELNPGLLDERNGGGALVLKVHADEANLVAEAVLRGADRRGQFGDTRRAPGRPEVDDQRSPPIIGERRFGTVEAEECVGRGRFACRGGVGFGAWVVRPRPPWPSRHRRTIPSSRAGTPPAATDQHHNCGGATDQSAARGREWLPPPLPSVPSLPGLPAADPVLEEGHSRLLTAMSPPSTRPQKQGILAKGLGGPLRKGLEEAESSLSLLRAPAPDAKVSPPEPHDVEHRPG